MPRVLVVEDERHIRLLITSTLRQRGYEVTEAKNGLEALHLLHNDTHFDLIISDIRMPQMDGIRFLEASKQHAPDVPVIILSAYADQGTEALEKGADFYIQKPFATPNLVNLVREVAPAS